MDLLLRNVRAAALAAAVLAVLVNGNSLANGFAYDDVHIILENEDLHSLETLPGAVFAPYWHGHEGDVALGLWRPTTTLLLGLQFAVAGENPLLYHTVNLLAHGAAAALVVLVLGHLTAVPVALMAGLVFAVHPVHVEAVANVVGGAEVVAAALVLWALLVHLSGPAVWGRALAVGAIFAVAFGAKESAVTLPALLFLTDAVRRRISWADLRSYLSQTWRVYVVLSLVAAGMLVARQSILGSVASPEAALGGGLLLEIPRIWTLGEVWSHYVRLMLFPLDLASDYSPGVIPISMSWGALNVVGVTLTLVALGAALRAWRLGEIVREGAEDPGVQSVSPLLLGFGVVWFLVAVSPVANIVFVSGVVLAERTLYLPSVGAAAVFGWALVWLVGRRREAGLALVVLVVVFMSVRSWTRTPTWKDDGTVFETLIDEYPQAGRSQWLMGDIYMTQGRTSDALRAYREAIPNLGAHFGLHTQIGRKLMGAGELEGAARLLEHVRVEAPDFGTAPALLGVIYTRLARWEDAERHLVDAVRLQPENTVSKHLWAGALTELGRYEEAATARRQVIAAGEDVWQQWSALADVEERAGNVDAALAALDSALVRVPEGEAEGVRAARERLAGLVSGGG